MPQILLSTQKGTVFQKGAYHQEAGNNMDANILAQYQIKNFSIQEITQNQNTIPVHYLENIIPTLCLLQTIRSRTGVPIFVNSTYRTPEHNRAVNGKPDSLHLVFNAIDFTPAGYTYQMLSLLFRQILKGDFITDIILRGERLCITPLIMGTGLYHSFIHIDTRGILGRISPAVWKG